MNFGNVIVDICGYAVLIDTWWNVNLFYTSLSLFVGRVLIDTWWNVNKNAVTSPAAAVAVLIDTW